MMSAWLLIGKSQIVDSIQLGELVYRAPSICTIDRPMSRADDVAKFEYLAQESFTTGQNFMLDGDICKKMMYGE